MWVAGNPGIESQNHELRIKLKSLESQSEKEKALMLLKIEQLEERIRDFQRQEQFWRKLHKKQFTQRADEQLEAGAQPTASIDLQLLKQHARLTVQNEVMRAKHRTEAEFERELTASLCFTKGPRKTGGHIKISEYDTSAKYADHFLQSSANSHQKRAPSSHSRSGQRSGHEAFDSQAPRNFQRSHGHSVEQLKRQAIFGSADNSRTIRELFPQKKVVSLEFREYIKRRLELPSHQRSEPTPGSPERRSVSPALSKPSPANKPKHQKRISCIPFSASEAFPVHGKFLLETEQSDKAVQTEEVQAELSAHSPIIENLTTIKTSFLCNEHLPTVPDEDIKILAFHKPSTPEGHPGRGLQLRKSESTKSLKKPGPGPAAHLKKHNRKYTLQSKRLADEQLETAGQLAHNNFIRKSLPRLPPNIKNLKAFVM